MNIIKLIKELQNYPEDAEVVIENKEWGDLEVNFHLDYIEDTAGIFKKLVILSYEDLE